MKRSMLWIVCLVCLVAALAISAAAAARPDESCPPAKCAGRDDLRRRRTSRFPPSTTAVSPGSTRSRGPAPAPSIAGSSTSGR